VKNRRTLTRICAAAALLLIGRICGADSNPVDIVRNAVHAGYPDVTIVDVRPAPIPGWYEVFTGNQLVYSDASGGHLFVGKLLETQTHKDLAAEQLEKRLTIDFQSLPFERAIKIVKGDGSHRLALFEDPDCPFCQQLEHRLTGIHDVTLYVFLYPFAELHPQARVHAHAIWCAPDPAAAWTHWMLEHKDPGSAECSGDPIDQLQSVGKALYVSSTPTIFLPSGQRIEGVVDAAQLQKLLETSAGANAVAAGTARAH
jgi:thiol:disulfide interchange protein DsbC